MEDVIRFWLERGVDGFRVDVIHKMIKDAALRDNPPPDPDDFHPVRDYFGQQHVYDHDRPEVHDVIRSWRRILDQLRRAHDGRRGLPARSAPRRAVLRRRARRAAAGVQLQLPVEPVGRRGLSRPRRRDRGAAARRRAADLRAVQPRRAAPSLALRRSARTATRAPASPRCMLLTLRGTPFLYYGEEIGMRDVDDPAGSASAIRSASAFRRSAAIPSARRCSGTARPAPASAAPPIPGCRWRRTHATSTSRGKRTIPSSLLSFYRRVIWYRKSSPALLEGAYRGLDSPPDTFVYRARARRTAPARRAQLRRRAAHDRAAGRTRRGVGVDAGRTDRRGSLAIARRAAEAI